MSTDTSASSHITDHAFTPRGEWWTVCGVCGIAEAAHERTTLLKDGLEVVHTDAAVFTHPGEVRVPPEGEIIEITDRKLTGGVKHDSGKPRYDLIPAEALDEVARVFAIGAEKYDDRNWEHGLKFGRVFAAMMRHAWAWWRGERDDPEDGQHHLSSVAWCALVLMTLEKTKPTYDDRPA
mgnify:CR=1 FL=1